LRRGVFDTPSIRTPARIIVTGPDAGGAFSAEVAEVHTSMLAATIHKKIPRFTAHLPERLDCTPSPVEEEPSFKGQHSKLVHSVWHSGSAVLGGAEFAARNLPFGR
jgi:hypothetical protein